MPIFKRYMNQPRAQNAYSVLRHWLAAILSSYNCEELRQIPNLLSIEKAKIGHQINMNKTKLFSFYITGFDKTNLCNLIQRFKKWFKKNFMYLILVLKPNGKARDFSSEVRGIFFRLIALSLEIGLKRKGLSGCSLLYDWGTQPMKDIRRQPLTILI